MIIRQYFSLLLIFMTTASLAQHVVADSAANDSLPRISWKPAGVRFGTDIISIIKDRRQENFSGWEMNGDVELHRYLLAAEYGKWGRDFLDDTSAYNNSGTYWRAGVDVNFLTRDPDRNVFFIGMRYARSKYSESMSLIAEDSVWGVVNKTYENTDETARWFELTTGLKVKVWKIFWLGYTARLKFGLKKNEDREMLSHDIPGYGTVDKDTYWGFNYYLMVRVPLRPDAPIIRSAKKKKK
jgi:hypothetical protein